LQTDYLDVYQLHWPKRKIILGNAATRLQEDAWEDNIHAVLETGWFCKSWKKSSILGCQMKIHGESCVLEESKYNNLPRVKRFKIPYSLNRLF
jgi:aryl-alcohol dehydrogenase-like predicted oxidoreductase